MFQQPQWTLNLLILVAMSHSLAVFVMSGRSFVVSVATRFTQEEESDLSDLILRYIY